LILGSTIPDFVKNEQIYLLISIFLCNFVGMKKRFLSRFNLFLGTASLLLAGCHTSRHAVGEQSRGVQADSSSIPGEIICMYGVMPIQMSETSFPTDTAVTEDNTRDSISQPESHQRPVIMVKYGVPPVRR